MSAGNPPSLTERQIRLQVARDIVHIFAIERITYLVLSGLTALIVIVECAITVQTKSDMMASGATLFGAGGVIAFNLARLLTMFNTVITKVFEADPTTPRGANSVDQPH